MYLWLVFKKSTGHPTLGQLSCVATFRGAKQKLPLLIFGVYCPSPQSPPGLLHSLCYLPGLCRHMFTTPASKLF